MLGLKLFIQIHVPCVQCLIPDLSRDNSLTIVTSIETQNKGHSFFVTTSRKVASIFFLCKLPFLFSSLLAGIHLLSKSRGPVPCVLHSHCIEMNTQREGRQLHLLHPPLTSKSCLELVHRGPMCSHLSLCRLWMCHFLSLLFSGYRLCI